MEAAAIHVVTTDVGDRHVAQAIDADGLSFGGEQSGHLIFRSFASTGDGLLTGALLCDLLVRTETALADLANAAMSRYPQVLVNVSVPRPSDVTSAPAVADAQAVAAARLGADGRVHIRASGTEPVVRVMVEAATADLATSVAQDLAAVVAATADASRESDE